MYLDGTYFQGNLVLPQYGRQPKNAEAGTIDALLTETVGEQSLDWLIARYEEEFLRKLLGSPLHEAWSEGLAAETPSQIWLDLKDRIFSIVGGIHISPAANYVYFFAMKSGASDTTMTGEKRQTGTFSENVSVVRKQVAAWNDMVDAVHHIREWIYARREDIADVMSGCVDFREWCGHDFSPINEYGI